MVNGWRTVNLGKVLRRVKDEISLEDHQTYKQVTVRLWNKGVTLRGEQLGSAIKTKRQYLIHTGQLILSRIDVRNGAIGLCPSELDKAIISNDFWSYDIDDRLICPEYLELYTKTPGFIKDANRTSVGTTHRIRSNEGAFLKIEIPMPPLAEQRRLVARIEALAERFAAVQSLRQQIGQDINAFISSYHIAYSADRKVQLKDILYLDEEKEIITVDGIYHQVGVKGFGKGLFPRETLTGYETTYKWYNRLYNGAIVLSQVKGWEGAIGVCDNLLAGKFVSPEYRTFRCIPDQAIPEYLASLVTTPYFYRKLKDLTRGVGARRERVRPEMFLELEIPMPDVFRQKKAVEIFTKLSTLQAAQAETERELDALLPSVLDRAFKGEL